MASGLNLKDRFIRLAKEEVAPNGLIRGQEGPRKREQVSAILKRAEELRAEALKVNRDPCYTSVGQRCHSSAHLFIAYHVLCLQNGRGNRAGEQDAQEEDSEVRVDRE